ncbi:MAG: hypothetical protein ACYCYF_03750 [Anaerolineae bacterium]
MRRPRQGTLLFVLLMCLGLASCGGPRIANHAPPAFAPLPDALESLADAQCPATEYGRRECDPQSALGFSIEAGGMGCDAVALPDALLGGLDPAYPLLLCEIHPVLHGEDLQEIMQGLEASGYYFFRGGGLWPVFTRYVIQDGEGLRLLKRPADLQATFAPIETPEEALSYALAATGLDARYGLQRESGMAYAVDALEDTYVTESDAGYRVLLYRHQVFGCGPHWTSAVEVLVEPDGSWSQPRTWDVFRDPDQDGLCVD